MSLGVWAGEWASLVGLLDRPAGNSYRLGGREVSGLEGGGPVSRGDPAGEARRLGWGPGFAGRIRRSVMPHDRT